MTKALRISRDWNLAVNVKVSTELEIFNKLIRNLLIYLLLLAK